MILIGQLPYHHVRLSSFDLGTYKAEFPRFPLINLLFSMLGTSSLSFTHTILLYTQVHFFHSVICQCMADA